MSIHVSAVYGQFVKAPYFVIVQSKPVEGHERLDKYFGTLPTLMHSVLQRLQEGSPEFLERRAKNETNDLNAKRSRKLLHVAPAGVPLRPSDSAHLESRAFEFEGYRFDTVLNRKQVGSQIARACEAAGVRYSSVNESGSKMEFNEWLYAGRIERGAVTV